MLSLLLAMRPKCSAFQSTTIFRLPTPRKPPKSMTAARTEPPRSTMTSTIRPISSSAGLRTSRPSTPWASAARMMVTEGGGTAGGTAGTVVGGGASRPACGGPVSSAAQDVTAAKAAKTITINANGRLARIWPPEVLGRRGKGFVCGVWQAVRSQLATAGSQGPDPNGDRRSKFKSSAHLTAADEAPPRSMRENDRHLDLAARPQNFQRHVIAVATDPEIDARGTELQVAQEHLVKECRQARVAQANFAALGVEFETECCFQQREWRRACPGLRRASDRIERRAAAPFTLKSAEQFGEPAQIHIARGVEQALEHLLDRMLQPVAREAECDQRVVMRPDRPVMIRHRIIACLAQRDGANTPAGEEVRPHQVGGDAAGTVMAHDAGKQQLPGIGRPHPAWLLGAVECQCIGPELLAPERIFKSLGETLRFRCQFPRFIHQAQAESAACRQVLAGKHIALDFGERDVALGEPSVGMKNGVVGILPALVGQSLLGGALIFNESILIWIARAVDPAQR